MKKFFCAAKIIFTFDSTYYSMKALITLRNGYLPVGDGVGHEVMSVKQKEHSETKVTPNVHLSPEYLHVDCLSWIKYIWGVSFQNSVDPFITILDKKSLYGGKKQKKWINFFIEAGINHNVALLFLVYVLYCSTKNPTRWRGISLKYVAKIRN